MVVENLNKRVKTYVSHLENQQPHIFKLMINDIHINKNIYFNVYKHMSINKLQHHANHTPINNEIIRNKMKLM